MVNFENNNVEEDNLNIFYLSQLHIFNVLCQKNNLIDTNIRGYGGCFKSVNTYIQMFEKITILDSISSQKAIGLKLIDDKFELFQANLNESKKPNVRFYLWHFKKKFLF